ncbi:diguanylate cyclase [Sinorhizobium numidicum]|uniref:diguanylate cyclase n=1 Tax=Sinorhizobium numidicum TaxID=680248 RepID=A0ABY8CYD1_9HYPH|nr:sensor domain-containing diguanylate cyclase [Sinorhizobium numidicum]WEX76997.1 diguanylate cyclase [Sinorhizobium numidicum]WEX83656.1 diguanylate cyclase [Sinorhizobium numidicum]
MTGEYVKALMGLQSRTPVLIALYDQHDRLRFANAAFRSAYHVGVDEAPTWADIVRRNHAAGTGAVIGTSDVEGWIVSALERRGSAPSRTTEADLYDGRSLLVTETVDEKGWRLSIAVDVTSMREEERKHRRDRDFAIRDSQVEELISVPDRRQTLGKLAEFIQNCAENPQMWGCVAIIDIDYFRAINDRYGPQRSDEVLLDFARQMQGFVRRTDCFGRIGGEEFMLILPDTTVSEANLILDRLLDKVRSARPLSNIPEFYYTCSVGLAEYREGDKVSDIYSRAGEALHLAKREGRDRVRRYTLPGSDHELRPDQTS